MPTETYTKGLKIRRDVLGAKYVDNAIASADEFNQPMQDLVTEYCWGSIWGREELPRKTRSLLNLAMLSALNRPKRRNTRSVSPSCYLLRGPIGNRRISHREGSFRRT